MSKYISMIHVNVGNSDFYSKFTVQITCLSFFDKYSHFVIKRFQKD